MDGIAPHEDFRNSSEYWTEIVGAMVVCGVISALDERSSRER
jgi:hypothetical protein